MTTGALLFLLGLALGFLGEALWDTAVELIDIYRNEER